jgi:hypothetical protein
MNANYSQYGKSNSHQTAWSTAKNTNAIETTERVAQMPERKQWVIELISRYAQERAGEHESARLAAAIVSRLKSMVRDAFEGSRLADTANHWLETWEPILDRNIKSQSGASSAAVPLAVLVRRARFD